MMLSFPHRICATFGFGGAVAVPTLPTSWATDLPDSGIEAGAIADWMEAFAASTHLYCEEFVFPKPVRVLHSFA